MNKGSENDFVANPGWNYKIVKYFLNNPQLTLMTLILLVVLGIGSFFQLRVEGFPAVNLPIAIVTTVAPGAGPETVQDTVTQPLASALADLEGVVTVDANSQSNLSLIFITYDDQVNVDIAVQDARNKIAAVNLPEGVNEPAVQVPDISGAPFFVAVTGGTDLLELKNQARVLETELLSIEGVKSFTNISGIEEKIYIELGPQYQSEAIVQQINAANVGFPLGETTIDGKRVPIVAKSSVESLEQLRQIPIALPDGQRVVLADIASVYAGVDYANRVHRTGYLDEHQNLFKIQPALLYEIRLDAGADLLALNKEVSKVVEEIKSENDKVDYEIVFNQAEQAQAQVDEIVEGAIGGKWNFDNPLAYVGFIFGGAWLLLICMLLFLDWRTALISVLAIPLSFLATFIVLAALDIQLNTLVLFSLVLVLGLIVDPAVVVLESIRRYVDIGYKGREAVLRSIDMIGLGLFVAVLTSVIVFVPFGLVSGTFGQIIAYIPWTVFPALIASYFIPLAFLTWLGAKFIKPLPGEELRDEDDIHTLWPVARWFIRANRYILQRTWLSVAVVVLGMIVPIVVTAVLFATNQVRQVQFAQPDDSQFVQLSIPRPADQTYRDLQVMATDVENVLKNYAGEIRSFFYQSMGGSGSQQDLSVFIELLPLSDRDRKSPEIISSLEKNLRQKFGEQVRVSSLDAGPPTDQFPVSVKIFESDPDKLAVASNRIADQLRSYEEVDQVITDYDRQATEYVLKVDSQVAGSVGLSAPAVYGQVAGLLGEQTLFSISGSEVVLRIPEDAKPATREALLSNLVFGQSGPIRLGDIATIEENRVAASITSLNGERFASVNASLKDDRDAINVQRRITDWAKQNYEQLGVNERAFEDRAGVNEFEKSFQELFLAIFLSIIASYVVLVILFKSFAQPFIILFAIPLILIGVFPALAIFNNGQFGFLETIGILMVIGIAENVGIFLIDYANRKVRNGMDKKEAIALASGIRLRPIVLTNATTLAGLLPLAVFSPFWRGLALVVIFGILVSGILALFTTPVLYNWFNRMKSDKINEGEKGSEDSDQAVVANHNLEQQSNEDSLPLPGAVTSNSPTELPPNLML